MRSVPKQGAFVETPSGYGVVTQVNLLRQMVKVKLDGEGDDMIKTYRSVEVAAVPGGRPKDGEPLPSVLKYIPEPEEAEEPEDEWKLPELFAVEPEPAADKPEQPKKRSSRSRRSRRGGKKPEGAKPAADKPESAKPAAPAAAPEEKENVKPRQRNAGHRGGKKPSGAKPAADKTDSAKSAQPPKPADGENKKKPSSGRRYYHRGRPKNKGGQTQNQ